jgi:hypothetical protein
MHFKFKLLIPGLLLFTFHSLSAQYGPRLFLDVPGIFFTAPDAKNIGSNMGAGTDASFNIATHNTVIRMGGGSLFTVNPKAEDLIKSFLITPFVKIEAGAGKYRSNGNKCAKTHRPAFTALAKAGIRYNFYPPKNRPDGTESGAIDYSVGTEFGYFYIRDIIKNYEVFASGNYYLKSKTVAAEAGFRVFFNLRGRRD